MPLFYYKNSRGTIIIINIIAIDDNTPHRP